ncbi:MAG: hypothetical protein KKI08_00750 [Armatimonadetes bacterium]|nr:hypothetical protein [Armatimonadota bacterium]
MTNPQGRIVDSARSSPPKSLSSGEIRHLADRCRRAELVETIVELHEVCTGGKSAASTDKLGSPRRLSQVVAVHEAADGLTRADCIVDTALWLLPVMRHVDVAIGHQVELAPTDSGFVVAASRGPHRGGIRAQVIAGEGGIAVEIIGEDAHGRGLLPAICAPQAGDPSLWADGTLVRVLAIPGDLALVLEVLWLVDRAAQMPPPVWFMSKGPRLGGSSQLDEE